jgi:hypothetical protein
MSWTADEIFQMLSRKPQPQLSRFDMDAAGITTPIHDKGPLLQAVAAGAVFGLPGLLGSFLLNAIRKKPLLGWADTELWGTGSGVVQYPVPRSNDKFYTIDVELRDFTVAGQPAPSGRYFIRIEVKPGTAAHLYCAGVPITRGDVVEFSGPVMIDCHPPPLPPPFLEVHAQQLRVRDNWEYFPPFSPNDPVLNLPTVREHYWVVIYPDLILLYTFTRQGQAYRRDDDRLKFKQRASERAKMWPSLSDPQFLEVQSIAKVAQVGQTIGLHQRASARAKMWPSLSDPPIAEVAQVGQTFAPVAVLGGVKPRLGGHVPAGQLLFQADQVGNPPNSDLVVLPPPPRQDQGTWRRAGDKVLVEWGSEVEEWDLPIRLEGQTGRSRSGRGRFTAWKAFPEFPFDGLPPSPPPR